MFFYAITFLLLQYRSFFFFIDILSIFILLHRYCHILCIVFNFSSWFFLLPFPLFPIYLIYLFSFNYSYFSSFILMTLFYYTSILISLSQIVYLFIRTRWEAMQKLLCVRTVDQQITITMKLYQHFDMPIERKISKINQKLMKIQRYVRRNETVTLLFSNNLLDRKSVV